MEKKMLGVPILKYNELDDDFKCGVCKHPLFIAPVYTCKSVGSICGSCSAGYHPCEMKPDKDDLLEQPVYSELASLVSFPCCFPPCEVVVKGEEQSMDHFISFCSYSRIKCPINSTYRSYLDISDELCEWQGTENTDLVKHIQETHSKYIIPSDSPKISLRSVGSCGRKLFIIIDSSDIISMIFIDYLGMMFYMSFRQNRPVRNMDICYFELIPSRSKGLRLWSYLLNGTLYGKLSKLSRRLVYSDTSRVLELHINKGGGPTLQHKFASPSFYFSPDHASKNDTASGEEPKESENENDTTESRAELFKGDPEETFKDASGDYKLGG